MFSDNDIKDLILSSKCIEKKEPKYGYKYTSKDKRVNLGLKNENGELFNAYIRQSNKFKDSFSIGLIFTRNGLPEVHLVHYNGKHGRHSYPKVPHHNQMHIHRITSKELKNGVYEPKKFTEITNEYCSFEEALCVFFRDIRVVRCLNSLQDLYQISFMV